MPSTSLSARLSLGARLARVPSVLVASRVRRIVLWGVAIAALAGVPLAVGMYAVAETPPSGIVRVGLDLVAILAVGLAYLLLTGRRRKGLGSQTAPIRTLWWLLVLALSLLGIESLCAVLVQGMVDPKTGLPMDAPTAAVAGIAAFAEGLFAGALLAGLRSLVLYRRKPLAVWLWGAFILSLLGVGLSMVAMLPSDESRRIAPALLTVFTIVAALGCAFRQGWVGVLTLRQRAIAAATALGLAIALIGLFFLRVEGPAQLAIVGAITDGGARPYAAAISVPIDAITRLILVGGTLYGLTAALVLLFQLPTSEALAQRAGERSAMRELARLAGRGLDLDSLASAVATAPVEAGLADMAWVALPATETGTLVPRIAAAHPLAPEVAARAADARALADAASGGPLVIEHAAADHRVHARPGQGIGSLAAFKLGTGPDAGTLVVVRRAPEAFQPDDVAALETFSAQGGLALANARLFEDTLERERLEREMSLARTVQQRLIPETLPEVPGLRLAAIEKPALTVGGDYYDAVTLGDDCVGVIVADVSGKGAGAAFYMAEMKGIFQVASRLTRSPSEFLCRANEALSPSLERGTFVSAIYGVIDGQTGTLALARAGHCPALLIHPASGDETTAGDPAASGSHGAASGSHGAASGSHGAASGSHGAASGSHGAASGSHGAASGAAPEARTSYLRPDGLALGLDPGPLFQKTLAETLVHLVPGDVVLLFTDGLVEARRASGEAYGYDRLAAAAVRLCPQNGACEPHALRDALLDDVAQFTGLPETDDDVTLMVVAWGGPPD